MIQIAERICLYRQYKSAKPMFQNLPTFKQFDSLTRNEQQENGIKNTRKILRYVEFYLHSILWCMVMK